MVELDGVVLVTGAATGIGRAIAGACADTGAVVAMVDINAHGAESAADQIRNELFVVGGATCV